MSDNQVMPPCKNISGVKSYEMGIGSLLPSRRPIQYEISVATARGGEETEKHARWGRLSLGLDGT